MEEHYDLSIIIPVHNTIKYLPTLFHSLAMQNTEGYKMEFIFVCDKCTDGSYYYIENNSDMLPFDGFQLIETNYGNAGAARNKGLNNSHGDWIWFIDSDDYLIRDDAVKVLNDIIEQYPTVNIVNFDFIINFYAASSVAGEQHLWPACWSRMVRRDLIGDTRFDETKIIGEDADFADAINNKKEAVVAFSKIMLYHYRYRREGSLTDIYGKR